MRRLFFCVVVKRPTDEGEALCEDQYGGFFLCCYIKGGQLMGGTLVKISEAFLCYGAGWRAWE